MADVPQPREEPSADLLGRWLAHHEREAADAAPDAEGPDTTPAAPRASRRMPVSATPTAAVERDPFIGSRVQPPAPRGARRSHAASDGVNELDRASPPGFEPVLLRSVRVKLERAQRAEAERTQPQPAAAEPAAPQPAAPQPAAAEPAAAEPAAPQPALAEQVRPEPVVPTARTSRLPLPRRTPRPGARAEPTARPAVHSVDAARELVAAKRARLAEAATAPPAARVAETAQAEPEPPVAEVAEPTAHAEPPQQRVTDGIPGVYAFTPKRSARRLLTVSMLAGLAVSAYLVRVAVETRETPNIGLAAIAVLATALFWAIRGGTSITTLTVRQGQLEVVRQGRRFVFDLASDFTPVEVRGRPGRRGWKVLFLRRDLAPFVVDSGMVDPEEFMRVLRFFRGELGT